MPRPRDHHALTGASRLALVLVTYATLGLLLTGVCLYLPHHLAFINARAAYYLFGRDAAELTDSLRSVASWGVNASMSSLGVITGWAAGSGATPAEL